jgi:hypothetical protein
MCLPTKNSGLIKNNDRESEQSPSAVDEFCRSYQLRPGFLLKKGDFMKSARDYLKEFPSEQDYMWSELAKLPMNRKNEVPQICENNGEGWQYMGSDLEEDNILFHVFRHRCHPKNSKRIYIRIKARYDFINFILSSKK